MDLLAPDFGLIIWQTLTLLVVLFILGKFAWKPITQAIHDREASIEEALESADKAKKEMENLKAENEKLQQEARQERDKIIKEANQTAEKIKEEAREEANKISSKMINDAKASIENEKQAALTDVKRQVGDMAIQIAEKILREKLDDEKSQKELVESYVEDLNLN